VNRAERRRELLGVSDEVAEDAQDILVVIERRAQPPPTLTVSVIARSSAPSSNIAATSASSAPASWSSRAAETTEDGLVVAARLEASPGYVNEAEMHMGGRWRLGYRLARTFGAPLPSV